MLSVLLSMLIIASVVITALPVVSAKGESAFTDCEEIFIDMRSFTGWTDASAAFRVFTFYNDSDSQNWCHEYEENFENTDWYNGTNILQSGIKAVKFCNNVYSFRIPANNISHVQVVRTNANSEGPKWNYSPMMWDNQRSKYTADGKSYSTQNCIKITGWDNSASWSTFTPTNNASYSETTANPDATITGNSNLFTIDSTFYDYYCDDEIQNGWGNIRYETNHTTQRSSKNGTGYVENGYWEPFQALNNKIASQASSGGVRYPLYFGNFYDKGDGYQGEGSSNMVNFSNWVNNSARLGDTHNSVLGLTGTELVNGNLMYASANGGTSSTKVPIFDKSWLQTNKVGSVVNTKFPMRKVTTNGVTGYYFDSSGGYDNVWFNSSHNTISYGQGTSKGARDSLASYGGSTNGYGFFPFDYNRGSTAEAYNFGFGMRVDVSFNLGGDEDHYGQIKGTNGTYVDQVFNFTGDDDVWVYIDGKLVLDLGGDHQKASGSINFANGKGKGKVSLSTGTNVPWDGGCTRNTDFSITNDDPTVEHTLTMFYVERGMVESNLSFNFNFAPIGNELIVDKTVNTTNINDGLKTAVAAADTFSFNQPTASGKTYTHVTSASSTDKTATGGVYTLKNGETADFKDQFAVPTDMTVTESESSPLTYTTSWKAIDLEYKKKGVAESAYTIASGTGTASSFTYQTLDNSSEFAMTRVQLSYVNTPSVAPVTIKKEVTGLNTGETDNTDFDGTVEVSLDNGSTWKKYPLTYTYGGSTYTLTSAGKLASGAKLRNGRTLTFAGIPQGAKVRFTEDATDVDHSFVSVTGSVLGISVGASGNAITVTNQKNRPGEINVTLEAKKNLTGADLTNDAFEFELLDSSRSVIETKPCFSNGKITFSAITYTSAANDTYYIREKIPATADSDIKTYDSSEYKVTVSVVKNGLTLEPTVTYYKNNVTVSSAEFNNEVKRGEVYIVKEDNAGNDVTGVQFAIYKVGTNGESLTGKTPLQTAGTARMNVPYSDGTTKQKTAVHFTDLDLYTDGLYNPSDKDYQWYAIAETDPGTNYFKNNTVIYFQLPVSGSYAPKYEYVNGHILSPNSGFDGMAGIKLLGIYAICFAILLGAAYVLYTKRNVKYARHRAKK